MSSSKKDGIFYNHSLKLHSSKKLKKTSILELNYGRLLVKRMTSVTALIAHEFDTRRAMYKSTNIALQNRFVELLTVTKPHILAVKAFNTNIDKCMGANSSGRVYIENISAEKLYVPSPDDGAINSYRPIKHLESSKSKHEMYIMPFSWCRFVRGEYTADEIKHWNDEDSRAHVYNVATALSNMGYDVQCYDNGKYVFYVVNIINIPRMTDVLELDAKRSVHEY